MSKEFEEIVIKKLETLDDKTTNTDRVIQNVILKKLEKLDNLETQVKENNRQLGKLQATVGKLEMEIKDTGEVVNYLNQNFTKFDYEINKKIDTLFDAFTTNTEKNSVQDKDIVSLNAKVFNHDLRISNLEDKVIAV